MTGLVKWELALSALLVGLAVSGCYQSETRGDVLRRRAAFDLHCTRDELEITRIDERTRGVRGCGKQATYLYVCEKPNNAFDPDCSWVMNTRGRDDDEDDSRPRRAVAAHANKRRPVDDDDQDDHATGRRQVADPEGDPPSKPRQMQDEE